MVFEDHDKNVWLEGFQLQSLLHSCTLRCTWLNVLGACACVCSPLAAAIIWTAALFQPEVSAKEGVWNHTYMSCSSPDLFLSDFVPVWWLDAQCSYTFSGGHQVDMYASTQVLQSYGILYRCGAQATH